MKYELWHSREGSSDIYTLLATGEPRQAIKDVAFEADAKIIRTFEADTWEEACRQQHEYLGLGAIQANGGRFMMRESRITLP